MLYYRYLYMTDCNKVIIDNHTFHIETIVFRIIIVRWHHVCLIDLIGLEGLSNQALLRRTRQATSCC